MSNKEYMKAKNAKMEAMRAKAAQQAQPVPASAPKVEPYAPKTFKEKWKNFWYHYKLIVIACVFVVICIVSLLWNVIFTEKFDASLIVVSEKSFTGATSIIQENLEKFLIDYDKNGKVESSIIPIQLEGDKPSNLSPEMLQMNQSKLFGIIAQGDTFLYLLDKTSYDQVKSTGVVFEDLTTLSKRENIINDKFKDKYDLSNTKLSEKLGLSGVLDGMFLCLVDFDSYDEKAQSKAKYAKPYEYEKDLLLKMIDMK